MYTRSFTCVQDDNTSTIFHRPILFGYKNEEGFARTCNRIQVWANCFSNLSVCVYKSKTFCKQIAAFYVLRTKTVRFWDGNHKREIAANKLLIIRKGKWNLLKADNKSYVLKYESPQSGNNTQKRIDLHRLNSGCAMSVVGAYCIRPNAHTYLRGCFQGVCDTPLHCLFADIH